MSQRYFNINTGILDSSATTFIEVEECNSSGEGSASYQVNRFLFSSLRYEPATTAKAAHIKIEGSGIQFTHTNVKNINGVAHAQANAYALYGRLALTIKETLS
ncbi:MAG: hypothetical protein ACOYLG_13400 [Chitinophagaceae bacterium]